MARPGRGARNGAAVRGGGPAVARAIEHARAAGDLRQERRNASSFAVAAVYGPTPVPEAIAECSRIAAEATGDHRTAGLVMGALAHLEAMRGQFDRARELSARARSILEELGNSVLAASTSLEAGAVELLAGNPLEAERLIRRDVAELERMGAAYLLSTTTALLAQAVAAQGRDAEAAELVEAGLRLTRSDDIESDVLLACVRSGLKVRAGDVAAAIEEARRAVALLADADAPVARAEALLTLAAACEAGGDDGAAAARQRAAAECEAKGYLVARGGRAASSTPSVGPPAAVRRRKDHDLDVACFLSFVRLTTHGSGEAGPGAPGAVRTRTPSWNIGILAILTAFGISDLSSTNTNRSGFPGENVWPMVMVEIWPKHVATAPQPRRGPRHLTRTASPAFRRPSRGRSRS